MNKLQDAALGPAIVCGADFSKGSALALRYAAAVAAHAGGHVLVVHVEDPLLKAASEAVGDRRGYLSTLEVELKAFVRQVLGRRARQTRVHVVAGDACEEMARLADRSRASLVVVGTRGLGGTRAVFLGSTADDVLGSSKVPVLVVPPRPRTVKTSVALRWPGLALVAIEPGPSVRLDVRAALDAAAWIGATSLPVTVLSPRADDAAIARALDVLGAAVRAAGGARVAEMRVRCGHAVDELVAETARARAGLVVARRRPSKGLFHLIRRSTTAQALRRLSVPLLLLPEGTAWVRRLR